MPEKVPNVGNDIFSRLGVVTQAPPGERVTLPANGGWREIITFSFFYK